MSTVSDLCDAIGRQHLAGRLGVRPSAISNAIAAGLFPAKWFTVVRAECHQRGLECPDSLFTFLGAAQTDSQTDACVDLNGDPGAAA